MSKLIDIKHPFQIKTIKSINEYLFILKNILRTISQKGAFEKPEGFSIPVRWSNSINDIVIDFGSNKQRDVLGIHKNNLTLYYKEGSDLFNSIVQLINMIKNCNDYDTLFDKYKLKKNENRFFNFIVSENGIYLSGLYNRCQNSKRSGVFSSKGKNSIIIDNSIEFILDVQQILDFLKIQEKIKIEKNYNSIYLLFLEEVEKIDLNLKESEYEIKRICFRDISYLNLEKKYLSIKSYKKILNKKDFIKDENIFWFLIYHITLLFNHVLLKSLNRSKIQNIILYDNISDELIKIVNDFKVDFEIKEKVLEMPIMPVSF